MSGTHARPVLASFSDTVTELIQEGVPFSDVEDAINAHLGLTEDQKAALWLFAFSLRDRSEQHRDARAHLTTVQVAAGDSEMTERARERLLGDAVEAARSEQAGAERYQRYQREVTSGKARATDGARPREFDAKGFPVPQRNRSFLERVARLLNPQ
ncbi:MAG: hypothetical protein AABM43_13920 [Actinomycetota bacterium]